MLHKTGAAVETINSLPQAELLRVLIVSCNGIRFPKRL